MISNLLLHRGALCVLVLSSLFPEIVFGKDLLDQKCELIPRVEVAARGLIDQSNTNQRATLRFFKFERVDPLGAFSNEVVELSQVLAQQAAIDFRRCDDIDPISNLLLSDKHWGARIIIFAAAQILKGERFNPNEILLAFHIGKLNERAVVGLPEEHCDYRSGPFAADFNGDSLQRWYRWRVLSWVECKDGSFQVYFPESGWSIAAPAHLRAITSSNPGVHPRKFDKNE